MRATIRRRQRNRRILVLSLVATLLAAVVVGAYEYYSIQSSTESMVGKPVSSTLYGELYTVALTSHGSPNETMLTYLKPVSGQPFVSNGKPIVLFISADYCPYCAFQRWPIVIALMRFGNFTDLSYMLSSPTDIFANSPTFSFYQSSYASQYVSFQGYEEADRSGSPLQKAPANYSSVFQQYGSSSYPFLDIGNKYYVSGAFETPELLDGKNWNQIASLLGKNNQLSSQVMSSADVLTAAICRLTGGNPASVCGVSGISSLTATLTSFDESLRAGSAFGTLLWTPSPAVPPPQRAGGPE